MPRKKKAVEAPVEEREPLHDWTTSDEFQHNGRWLRPGTEFTVHGVKGRLRFIKHVLNNATGAAWVEGFDLDRHYRAFRPDRIKTVHYTTRTRENAHG
jgi:hypothetical protein